jgi:signal peptidase I
LRGGSRFRPRRSVGFRPGLVLLAGVMGAIALASLRGRLLDSVVVQGRSMYPTFAPGTRLLVSRTHCSPGDLKRSDVVILYDPIDGGLDVKRVVALGGDTVAFSDVDLWVNEKLTRTPRRNAADSAPRWQTQVSVPCDAVFVMGDNRPNSMDSRSYGPVPLKQIRGRAILAFWPPRQWGRGQRRAR